MKNQACIEDLRRRIALIEEGGAAASKLAVGSRSFVEEALVPVSGANDAACEDGAAVSKNSGAFDPNSQKDAFLKLQRIASRRECSAHGISQKLMQAGYSPFATEAAVARAVRCGLIDDQRFADVLVRSRVSQGKGANGIARELDSNGIDPATVHALADLKAEDESEYERARAMLEKHPPRAKNKREGAFRFLVRRGYSTGVASTVAREWAYENME